MSIDPKPMPETAEIRFGLPHPDWGRVWEWLDTFADAEMQAEAWNTFARQWLSKLGSALSSDYRTHESDGFLLLSCMDEQSCQRILRWCESSKRKISGHLPDLAATGQLWKWAVLAISGQQAYYDYVADFYHEDGEFGLSGGMCMSEFGHIALCVLPNADLERTIAHELVHSALMELPLPLWLNEGVTQILEDMVVDRPSFLMSTDIKREHREFWSQATINEFWSGKSFHRADDGQRLSYNLAEVLVLNMISDYRTKLKPFLAAANWKDAGESAAREIFGVGLGDRVAQFLGPGNWQPSSDYETIDAEKTRRNSDKAQADCETPSRRPFLL